LRYTFPGDLRATVEPVLSAIESRLSWRPQRELPLVERVRKLGGALLAVKEVEYIGTVQSGPVADRLPKLVDAARKPLEANYRNGKSDPGTIARAKWLRAAHARALLPG